MRVVEAADVVRPVIGLMEEAFVASNIARAGCQVVDG
jgi:hypothetical protein